MPQYMAPQILEYKKYGKAVDFWCLGSLMYEMLTGQLPFYSQNLHELYENIKYKEFQADKQIQLSDSCIDLLKKLFNKSPQNRIGVNSITQLKTHQFFNAINWQGVIKKKYRSPFVPILQNQQDTSYFSPQITQGNVYSISSYNTDNNFREYQYDDNQNDQNDQNSNEGFGKFQGFQYFNGETESDQEKKDKYLKKKLSVKESREKEYK